MGQNEEEAPGDSGAAGSPMRTVSLGPGSRAPYPNPTSAAASRIGRGNRRTGTKPEMLVRSALHRRGLRFRKDHLIRASGVTVRPDVVFTRRMVAVFVDGCFWHSCPAHQVVPKSNTDYWVPKFQANAARDQRVDAALHAEGWLVVRIWEHEDPEEAAMKVEQVVSGAV